LYAVVLIVVSLLNLACITIYSLGADHDGTGDSSSCRADDQFLMAPNFKYGGPHDDHLAYRWKFSMCSINSFKEFIGMMRRWVNVCQWFRSLG